MNSEKLLTGFPDGTFRPNYPLTRAQVAVTLVKAMGLKLPEGQLQERLFSDLAGEHWAYRHIIAASRAGLIKGDKSGNFRPDDYISRAEAAVLLFKYAGKPVDIAPAVQINDVSAGHWAYKHISASMDAKFLALAAGGNFLPDSPLSRAEWARGLSLVMNLNPDYRLASLQALLTVKKSGVEVITGGTSIFPEEGRTIKLKVQDKILTRSGIAELNFSDGTGVRIENDSQVVLKTLEGYNYLMANGSQNVGVDMLEMEMTVGEMFYSLATRLDLEEQDQSGSGETNAQTNTALNHKKSRLVASRQGFPELVADAATTGGVPWYKLAQDKKVRVKVDMPWGVASVRGTTGNLQVNEDGSISLACYRGESTLRGRSGQEVEVRGGSSSAVTGAGQSAEQPSGLTQEQKDKLVQEAQWFEERIHEQVTNQPVSEISPPPPPPVMTQQLQQQLPQQQQPVEQIQQQPEQQSIPSSINEIVNSVVTQTFNSISGNNSGSNNPAQSQTGNNPGQTTTPSSGGGGGGGGGSGGGGGGSSQTASKVAEKITSIPSQEANATVLDLPEIEGFTVSIKSSDYLSVISLDGKITPQEQDVTVELVLTVIKKQITHQQTQDQLW